MRLSKILRNAVAGALIAAVPVSTTFASVRPNAAVPAAGGAAVTAQSDDNRGRGYGVSLMALGVIGLALAVAIWIALDKDSEGRGDLSRG